MRFPFPTIVAAAFLCSVIGRCDASIVIGFIEPHGEIVPEREVDYSASTTSGREPLPRLEPQRNYALTVGLEGAAATTSGVLSFTSQPDALGSVAVLVLVEQSAPHVFAFCVRPPPSPAFGLLKPPRRNFS